MKPWQYQGFLLDTLRHFKNMEGQFKIRSYGYGELAQLYFPNITKKSASWQLTKWIKADQKLLESLMLHGYRPNTRRLKPKHVRLIIDAFDYP